MWQKILLILIYLVLLLRNILKHLIPVLKVIGEIRKILLLASYQFMLIIIIFFPCSLFHVLSSGFQK
jgi:hypothetical protein